MTKLNIIVNFAHIVNECKIFNLETINLAKLRTAINGIKEMINSNKLPIKDLDLSNFKHIELSESNESLLKMYEEWVADLEGVDACFIGLFMFVKGLEPVAEDCIVHPDGNRYFSIFKYSERILDVDCHVMKGYWDFLFSAFWDKFQPSLEQSIYRAELILNNKYKSGWEYK